MRSKRTDRQELKRALARLEAENAALKTRLAAGEAWGIINAAAGEAGEQTVGSVSGETLCRTQKINAGAEKVRITSTSAGNESRNANKTVAGERSGRIFGTTAGKSEGQNPETRAGKEQTIKTKAGQERYASAAAPTVSSPPATAADAITAPPAVALCAGGYPTRAAPRTAKTLKEAKEILMNSVEW